MACHGRKDSFPDYHPMPKCVHRHISEQLKAKLSDHFRCIKSPLEKFETATYGNVTILLAEPVGASMSLDKWIWGAVGLPLLNIQYETEDNPAVLKFLHPWPQLSELNLPSANPEDSTAEEVDATIFMFSDYAEVILKVWKSEVDLHAYRTEKIDQGLMTMLGKIISPHGLTYKPDGLYLRIQDVEQADKRLSCVKIATNKDDIRKYLGLEWRAPYTFDTWTDLMDYATTCRFYNPAHFRVEATGQSHGSRDGDNQGPDPDSLNMINYFIKIYLPAHAANTGGKDVTLSRKKIRCDVKDYFGPRFAQRFEQLRTKAMFKLDCARLFCKIRKEMPKYVKGADLTFAIKGFKRLVGLYDANYKNVTVDALAIKEWEDMREAFEQRRYRAFRSQAKRNWIFVGAYQKWLDAKRSAECYKAYKTKQEAEQQERGKVGAESG